MYCFKVEDSKAAVAVYLMYQREWEKSLSGKSKSAAEKQAEETMLVTVQPLAGKATPKRTSKKLKQKKQPSQGKPPTSVIKKPAARATSF